MDGVGEWETTTIAKGRNNQFDTIKSINFPHSIGLLYSAFTYFLGFKVNCDEYKVMGLAPYREPLFEELIYKHLKPIVCTPRDALRCFKGSGIGVLEFPDIVITK